MCSCRRSAVRIVWCASRQECIEILSTSIDHLRGGLCLSHLALLQIIDGQWYIVGETHNFLTIHLKTKQVLADFAARYKGRLPDVDFVLQTSDWLPPAFNGDAL